MAFCTGCGTNVPDGNQFCTGCGKPMGGGPAPQAQPPQQFRQPAPAAVTAPPAQAAQYAPAPPYNPGVSAGGRNAVMGTLGYIGTMILLAIPIVGFILCIVWSFSGTVNLNKRNLSRAYLILWIIGIVFGILVTVLMSALVNSLISQLGNSLIS